MSTWPLTRVFFDSDALIAGSASRQGASFILLQLAELGLIDGVTSDLVYGECIKNIRTKLPEARNPFEKIVKNALSVHANPGNDDIAKYEGWAHPKDLPILVSAIQLQSHFLVTFNTRDYHPGQEATISITEPGSLLKLIRTRLSDLG